MYPPQWAERPIYIPIIYPCFLGDQYTLAGLELLELFKKRLKNSPKKPAKLWMFLLEFFFEVKQPKWLR